MKGPISCRYGQDYNPLLAEALHGLQLGSKSRVLNIACEEELVPKFLPSSIDPANVYGVEIDEDVIRRNANIKRCDVDREPLPFADNTFELVVSIWGVEHFKTAQVFTEARRVLKPGGRLIFITPNTAHPIFWVNKLLGGMFSRPYFKYVLRTSYNPHETFYRFNRKRAVQRAAQNAGLRLHRLVFFGPSYVIYYFNFSKTAQRLVSWLDRALFTNPILYRFKPYLVGVLQK
ncbi:MAG: methyltransferase domain-containing protein [Parcubacteria group bacterium]